MVARGHLFKEPARSCVNARERTPGTPFASSLAREIRESARIACRRCYSSMAGEALNPSADENPEKTSPPPAPRSRPSALAPTLKLRGEIGRTARCPPPRPRGARLPCNTPHTKSPEFARGHLAPLRCSALRQEPAPSLLSAR